MCNCGGIWMGNENIIHYSDVFAIPTVSSTFSLSGGAQDFSIKIHLTLCTLFTKTRWILDLVVNERVRIENTP